MRGLRTAARQPSILSAIFVLIVRPAIADSPRFMWLLGFSSVVTSAWYNSLCGQFGEQRVRLNDSPHSQSIMPTKRKQRKNGPVRGIRRKFSKSSPRKNRRFPHLGKKVQPPPRNELNYLEIAANHDRYLRVFLQSPDSFWREIEKIRSSSDEEPYALVSAAIREIPKHLLRFLPAQLSEWRRPSNEWKQADIEMRGTKIVAKIKRLRLRFLPKQVSKSLIKAVRDSGKNGFPSDREKRAEFLAKSLARNGIASPRTSRDNCLEARQKLRQQAEETATIEGYILSPIA